MDKKFYKTKQFIKWLLILWVILVIIDCVRLRFAEFDSKPLILLSSDKSYLENEFKDEYYHTQNVGLGYCIDYISYNFEDSKEKVRSFMLFSAIPVWTQSYSY